MSPVECYPCNWGSCLFVSAAMTDTLLIQCKSIGQSLFTAIGISPEPISGYRGINGSGNGVNEKVFQLMLDIKRGDGSWGGRRPDECFKLRTAAYDWRPPLEGKSNLYLAVFARGWDLPPDRSQIWVIQDLQISGRAAKQGWKEYGSATF